MSMRDKANRANKRVSTVVHTRKLDRSVAHAKMKKAGLSGVNKHHGRGTSFFSGHWREAKYVSI